MSATTLSILAAEVGTSDRTLRRAVNDGVIRATRTSPYKLALPLAERAYIRRHWPLIATLRAGLRLEHSVECAVLFGSIARGDDDAGSDVDLLVWLRPGANRLAIARRLSDRLGRRVQIVDAADATRNPSLVLSVLRDGRPLVDRAGRWETLVRRRARIARAAKQERARTAEKAAAARKFFEAAAA